MPNYVFKIVYPDGEERSNAAWTRADAIASAQDHLGHHPGPPAHVFRALRFPGGHHGVWTYVEPVQANAPRARAACACQSAQGVCACQAKSVAARSRSRRGPAAHKGYGR